MTPLQEEVNGPPQSPEKRAGRCVQPVDIVL